MRKILLIGALLAAFSASSFAATPQDLWQQYQSETGAVSAKADSSAKSGKSKKKNAKKTAEAKRKVADAAGKSAPKETAPKTSKSASSARITVERKDGTAAAPTTPEEAKAALKTAGGDTAAAEAKPAEAATSAQPAKAKARPSLVKNPPASVTYMRQPQGYGYSYITNSEGGYSVALPLSFGPDPLDGIAPGPMLVRCTNNNLMCAVTIVDPSDQLSYRADQPLPDYPDKTVKMTWPHRSGLNWNCKASIYDDYYGKKLIFEAESKLGSKTYQMLFVAPAEQLSTYLPQILYSLNSFKLLKKQ